MASRRAVWRRGLVRNAAQLPPKKPALVGFDNVVQLPPPADDTLEMERPPTGMELRVATAMYEAQFDEPLAALNDDDVLRWIWIKTARLGIRELRALSYDVTSAIRGKPFYDAKGIWETIIDTCSPV